MKRILATLWFAALLMGTLHAETASDNAQGRIRLRALPITLYPEVSLPESVYPAFMNRHARPEDAVVLSYLDAFKSSARVAKLGVERGQVWIHVTSDRDLTQQRRRHVEGASAILFVPSAHPQKGSGDILSIDAASLARSTNTLGCALVVGLEPADARTFAKVREVAAHGSVLTIYDNQKLRGGPATYRRYAERLVAEARAVNPQIKIEIAVCTGANETVTRSMVEILLACSHLADRIGIYCDDTPASLNSLVQLYALLRDERV